MLKNFFLTANQYLEKLIPENTIVLTQKYIYIINNNETNLAIRKSSV